MLLINQLELLQKPYYYIQFSSIGLSLKGDYAVKVVREFFAHKLFKYFEIRGSMLIGL